jgi:hypothetical protein
MRQIEESTSPLRHELMMRRWACGTELRGTYPLLGRQRGSVHHHEENLDNF